MGIRFDKTAEHSSHGSKKTLGMLLSFRIRYRGMRTKAWVNKVLIHALDLILP